MQLLCSVPTVECSFEHHRLAGLQQPAIANDGVQQGQINSMHTIMIILHAGSSIAALIILKYNTYFHGISYDARRQSLAGWLLCSCWCCIHDTG